MSVAKPKLTRREQREASRKAILEAAADQFSRFGFEGASLNAISDQSGVSKQNLIYYFESKEKLWEAAVAHTFDSVNAAFREHWQSRPHDQIQSLRDSIRIYFDVARRYPAYVLIPMIEGINDTWRSELLAKKYLAPHVTSFETFIGDLIEAGEITDVPALHVQNLVAGGAQLFLALAPLWAHAVNKDTTSEAFLTTYADTVVKLLTE